MEFVKQQTANGADEEKVWAEFEAVAGELDGCLCRYLKEDISADFVDAVLRIRARDPRTTTIGIFNVLMSFALRCIAIEEGLRLVLGEVSPQQPQPAKKTKRRNVRVVGVPGNKRGRAGVSIREA